MAEDPKGSQTSGESQQPEPPGQAAVVPQGGAAQPAVQAASKRPALRDVRRQIEEKDFANPGVQRMLLDDLDRAEAECELLRGYIDRFHEADKRAAVLEEKQKAVNAIEVAFGAMSVLGGAIFGLAPFYWDKQPAGWLALVVGLGMIVGGSIIRVVKR